jgi:catechol 2,3-dioxygenase-like lactoylglutathione lyase family enzyme
MRLEQIDHVALRCASPEVTMRWYVSTLGFEHVFPGQWAGVPIFLRLGSTCIALFQQQSREPPSARVAVSHLAFRAATQTDFQSAQGDLKTKGIPFEFQDHEISHSIYFADPDGFQLEITTYDVPPVAGKSPPA